MTLWVRTFNRSSRRWLQALQRSKGRRKGARKPKKRSWFLAPLPPVDPVHPVESFSTSVSPWFRGFRRPQYSRQLTTTTQRTRRKTTHPLPSVVLVVPSWLNGLLFSSVPSVPPWFNLRLSTTNSWPPTHATTKSRAANNRCGIHFPTLLGSRALVKK